MSEIDQSIPFLRLNADEQPASFDIRPLQRNVHPEDPHRHLYQELLWVKNGSGQHQIDHIPLEIQPATFYLIGQGQVHSFAEGVELDGFLLRFTDDFLMHDLDMLGWDYRMTLFSHFTAHRMFTVEAHAIDSFDSIMQRMWAEIQHQRFGQQHILRHLLSILLILLERARQDMPPSNTPDDHRLEIFQQFVSHLEQDYAQNHSVQHYAQQAHLTQRQLSEIVKQFTGQTAKKVILERVILEAKRYLQHTNASIKEIAFALGFKDSSYFSKVFKHITGVAPNEYKSQIS